MAAIQNVSLTAPTDYSAESLAIERRRRLAEQLQAQNSEPLQTNQMAGGYVVPVSPYAGLAKALNQGTAGFAMHKADEAQKDLAKRYQDDLSGALTRAQEAQTGFPAMAAAPAPSDELGGGPGAPARAAVAPDRQAMVRALMSHPATQGMAMAQMTKDMDAEDRKRKLADALGMTGGSGAPGAAGGTSGGAANPFAGLPPQVVALMTSGDPELVKLGTTLMEANKGIAQRPGAPVVNPFTGAVIAQPTPSVPNGVQLNVGGPGGTNAAQVPGYAAAMAGQHEIPNASTPPIKLPTSGGQTIELTQPEYVQWQKTGQLPPRFGQSAAPPQSPPAGPAAAPPSFPSAPQGGRAPTAGTVETPWGSVKAPAQTPPGWTPPTNVPPQDMPAFNAVAARKTPSAYGVIGATQTQEDVTRQAGQVASNTEAGREFISEMRQNYAKLRDVPATLANIEHAKGLAAADAKTFMGPLGESKLALTKFFRANVPGMGNLKTDSVTSAEELQSTLFNQVMDNLKKMDASPSQYQQQVMQEAFGTLRTDPASVPKIMDVFAEILKNRVSLHNQTVESAEGRGTTFPYDVRVNLSKQNMVKDVVRSGKQPPAKVVKWSDL